MEKENKNIKSDNALREEAILAFWKENKIFQKSLDKEAPKGNYVFYDGPPFATGQIHYGHILGSTAKDVIGRYQTMQGYHVPRNWGWDCHGLPIEHLVEKELGIAGHNEIEKLGIDKFVEYARSKVLQFDKEWEKGIERIGRWVDFAGGYKTMDNTFIESVWWALGELHKKELVYEGVRVLAYCARCETPIANSEIAMDNSYKDITDISVYAKLELVDELGTYLLAWTTTPWTLPGNTAIAINKDIEYVKVMALDSGKKYIFAKELFEKVKEKFTGEINTEETFKGEKLVGKKYLPVFKYYENVDLINKENIYKVWHADFVTTEKGTGIAHEAPAFGEDDMDLAKEHNIPWIIHVDEEGKFKGEVLDFAGQKVKPAGGAGEKDVNQKADIEVIKYLAKNDLLFAKEKIVHSYPHCMRCDTPIIYYALPSWFINITKVKDSIVKNASSMNWIPSHLKEGRFGHSLAGAPDWNISRNRYWASPLPIWKSQDGKIIFASSIEDIKNKGKKSGNKYFVMRHGGTEGNAKDVVSFSKQIDDHLTEKGKQQVRSEIGHYKGKIDMVFCSPFTRTKETAEIVCDELKIPKENLIIDDRLHEINPGIFDGKNWNEYHDHVYNFDGDWFSQKIPQGESLGDVGKRVGEALYEIEEKYKDKNILFITHGGPAWLFYVLSGEYLPHKKEYQKANTHAFVKEFRRFQNGEIRELDFAPLPHNQNFELDLHRPYIDEITLVDENGLEYKRIPEVLDCWFESGSMPFAQDHYPFENADWQKNNFPAGFVAEYIAQTRTWFYYTHAISSMLFGSAPFANVVTTGTLRAEDGHKMSKSKKNYPDPWILIDKYGVDALRIYLMASPLMKGEDANFSEKHVQEIASKVIGRLGNVFSFYELYRDHELEKENYEKDPSPNALDQWIVAKLNQTINEATIGMNAYDMAEAIRPMDQFVDDLSVWYLRRSREKIKDGALITKLTLYYVLKNFVKILAPFAPFISEDIWQKLKGEGDEESVHLTSWPTFGKRSDLKDAPRSDLEENVLVDMKTVREIVSTGLQLRQKAGIPVRQPLSSLQILKNELGGEYLEIIKDELNVKEIKIGSEIVLDTNITLELKEEGNYRELVRAVQDMRKKMELVPSDVVEISIETNDEGQNTLNKFIQDFKKTAGISEIKFVGNDGSGIKVGDLDFKIKIEK